MSDPLIKLNIAGAPDLLGHYLPSADTRPTRLKKGQKTYFLPKLPEKIGRQYIEKLDWINTRRRNLAKNMRYAALAEKIMPLAGLVDFHLEINQQKLGIVAGRLAIANQPYFEKLSTNLQKLAGSTPTGPNPKKWEELFPQNIPGDRQILKLINFQPLNENLAIIAAIYGQTWLNYDEIHNRLDQMSFSRKSALLDSLIKSSAPIDAQYQLEAIVEPAQIRKLSAKGAIFDVDMQLPSPFFGYDFEAGEDSPAVTEMVESSFDDSYKLYSTLQKFGGESLAQLAVLRGHRQRFRFKTDWRRISASSKDPFVIQVIDKLRQVHPHLFRPGVIDKKTANQ